MVKLKGFDCSKEVVIDSRIGIEVTISIEGKGELSVFHHFTNREVENFVI